MDIAARARDIYAARGFDTGLLSVEPAGERAMEVRYLKPGQYSLPDIRQKFSLDTSIGMSYDGSIRLLPHLRGSGIGNRLVEAREELCKDAGIDLIVITFCENARFWRERGYHRPSGKELRRLRAHPDVYHSGLVNWIVGTSRCKRL